ncbi:MAG: hypothetical protein IPK77_00705 [Cellvibrio sp.]|nr:hypothetical protein [Cellvibrio sp.]
MSFSWKTCKIGKFEGAHITRIPSSWGECIFKRNCFCRGRRPAQPSPLQGRGRTEGVSKEIMNLCTHTICIPMNNGVESLNVAVTAALIAFR